MEIIKNGGEVLSEVDLNPQFHPDQEVDLDIFSNKKRELKHNEDALESSTNGVNHTGASFNSEKKLVTNTENFDSN